jgi:hypothetical protein
MDQLGLASSYISSGVFGATYRRWLHGLDSIGLGIGSIMRQLLGLYFEVGFCPALQIKKQPSYTSSIEESIKENTDMPNKKNYTDLE